MYKEKVSITVGYFGSNAMKFTPRVLSEQVLERLYVVRSVTLTLHIA